MKSVIERYDEVMQSRKWIGDIPFLRFPSYCEVKIIPPFDGRLVRFIVKHKNNELNVELYYNEKTNAANWYLYDINNLCIVFDIDDASGLEKEIRNSLNPRL